MSSLYSFGIPIPLHDGWALLFNVVSSLESFEMCLGKLLIAGLHCIPIETSSLLFHLLCISLEDGNCIENF